MSFSPSASSCSTAPRGRDPGQNLTARDFGGEAYRGCNEHLVLTLPESSGGGCTASTTRRRLHASRPTPSADSPRAAEYGLATRRSRSTARRRDRRRRPRSSRSRRPRFVAGLVGPTTRSITVTGGVHLPPLVRTSGCRRGPPDGGRGRSLLTTQDTRNLKAWLIGVEQAFGETGRRVPDHGLRDDRADGDDAGRQAVDALYAAIMHVPLLSVA